MTREQFTKAADFVELIERATELADLLEQIKATCRTAGYVEVRRQILDRMAEIDDLCTIVFDASRQEDLIDGLIEDARRIAAKAADDLAAL